MSSTRRRNRPSEILHVFHRNALKVPMLTSRHMLVEACMSGDPNRDEWNLLRDQFRALVREGSDSIEDIFDVQFRCRFSELINQVADGANRCGGDGGRRV